MSFKFIGRQSELEYIKKIQSSKEASILIVYGRRRTGKTKLIEETFKNRNLLKFEGLEGQSEAKQKKQFLLQMSERFKDPSIAKLKLTTWTEIFVHLFRFIEKDTVTVYLEEIQWMSNYQSDLISELKYVWDNYFKNNKKLILILCGSSPSFIINKVLHSKALYNRSLHQIHLKEFTVQETQEFLSRPGLSPNELMDAYLSIGGIPEYLKYLKKYDSVYLGLCNESFLSRGFFTDEYSRIFTSSLSKKRLYQKTIELLSKNKKLTREQLADSLNVDSGGTFSELLQDLIDCEFIEKIVPLDANMRSTTGYYQIRDSYLQFYFKFIAPFKSKISYDHFKKDPTKALNMDTYRKWLGFSFERWCRRNSHLIADKLGFGSVEYESGAYFNRKTLNDKSGVQVDLLFKRKDRVWSICEIKYLESEVGLSVVNDFEKKLEILNIPKTVSVSKVLITASQPSKVLLNKHYFDRIVTLEDLLK